MARSVAKMSVVEEPQPLPRGIFVVRRTTTSGAGRPKAARSCSTAARAFEADPGKTDRVQPGVGRTSARVMRQGAGRDTRTRLVRSSRLIAPWRISPAWLLATAEAHLYRGSQLCKLVIYGSYFLGKN